MAEQLALQQLRRNRPAVDRHEGLVPARRMFVDRTRHHFLAGARFAQHQHGGIERCDLADQAVDADHRRRVADKAQATGLAPKQARIDVAHGLGHLLVAQRERESRHTRGKRRCRRAEAFDPRRVAGQQYRNVRRGGAQQGELALRLDGIADAADVHGAPGMSGFVHLAAGGAMLRPVAEEVECREHGVHTRLVGLDDQEVEFLHRFLLTTLLVWRPHASSGIVFFIGADFPSPA